MIAALLTASRLCAAVASLYGSGVTARDIDRTVPIERACRASVIIVLVADEWRPELVASIAVRESSMLPALINPTTGACGPGQVLYSHDKARQDRRCRRVLADEWTGYRAAVAKLRDARAYCRRPGELCALSGYVSGPSGVRRRWFRTPRSIQRRADRLRALMGPPARTVHAGA